MMILVNARPAATATAAAVIDVTAKLLLACFSAEAVEATGTAKDLVADLMAATKPAQVAVTVRAIDFAVETVPATDTDAFLRDVLSNSVVLSLATSIRLPADFANEAALEPVTAIVLRKARVARIAVDDVANAANDLAEDLVDATA